MSDETFADLEDAIRAHVASEADGDTRILTEWYLITAAASETLCESHYLHVCSVTPLHSLFGLVELAHRRLIGDASGYSEVDDE